MAFFRCKELGEPTSLSEYSEYILIYDCDIEWNPSSWWDIRRLKEGNKVLLIVNDIYMNNNHIEDSNQYGYHFLKTTIGLFDTIEDAISAFNNSDILSHYPVQRRTDYYYLYYAGYNNYGWDWTRPYYASKTFALRTGNRYDANPHPKMRPKVS